MSYSCTISFKQIPACEVYPFLQSFKKEVTSHLKEIAEKKFSFSPFADKCYKMNGELAQMTNELRSATRDWAAGKVFRYRYFYDAELQLLGVYGVPYCIEHLFDCTVCFQNSCDQDYDYEEWNGVAYFETVASKWKNKADEEVLKAFKEKRNEEWNEEHCSSLEYYRKTFVYEEIWEKFENTLFDDDSVIYLSLFGSYDYHPLGVFVKHVENHTKAWLAECGGSRNAEDMKDDMKGSSLDTLSKEELSVLKKIMQSGGRHWLSFIRNDDGTYSTLDRDDNIVYSLRHGIKTLFNGMYLSEMLKLSENDRITFEVLLKRMDIIRK